MLTRPWEAFSKPSCSLSTAVFSRPKASTFSSHHPATTPLEAKHLGLGQPLRRLQSLGLHGILHLDLTGHATRGTRTRRLGLVRHTALLHLGLNALQLLAVLLLAAIHTALDPPAWRATRSSSPF